MYGVARTPHPLPTLLDEESPFVLLQNVSSTPLMYIIMANKLHSTSKVVFGSDTEFRRVVCGVLGELRLTSKMDKHG